jgi:ribose transport system ATP-binding protein
VLRGIAKRFGPTVALDGVDLTLAAGHVAALVGENGAGKSTLMNVLTGAVRPDRGEMWLDREPFRPRDPLEARRRGLAIVHQELALAPHLSVEENLFLGVEVARWGWCDRGAMRARVREVLARLGHGDLDPATPAGRLPLSTRQLLEIARTLVFDSRVVIFDEPTSALTRADVDVLFGVIRRLRAQGLTVIYISHVLEEVEAVADSVTVLRDGRVVAPALPPATPSAEIVQAMVGRPIRELYPRSARRPGPVVLEVRGLQGRHRPFDASFELRRGEILGIAGLAGAGRSELLRAIFGLEPVVRGSVRLAAAGKRSPDDFTQPTGTPSRRLAQGVGLLSEDRTREGVALSLSITDNLTLSRLPGRWGCLRPARLRALARDLVARLRIRCRHERQPVAALSGGNQQKVALGRLLHHDVEVLLLDEPTRGVDVGTKAEIYRLLDTLVAEQGKAIVWVSSYLPELLGMADRVAVLRRGRLLPARPVAELTEHEVLLDCVG